MAIGARSVEDLYFYGFVVGSVLQSNVLSISQENIIRKQEKAVENRAKKLFYVRKESGQMIDTHVHYTHERFDNGRDEIVRGLKKNGIEAVIEAAISFESNKIAIEYAKKIRPFYDTFYLAVGIHPQCVDHPNLDRLHQLRDLALVDGVVAIGETGLDYHRQEYHSQNQKWWFCRQMELAGELKLPLIIHSRAAEEDTIEMMREYADFLRGGVIHCFNGDIGQAEAYMELGFYLGIGGAITYGNEALNHAVKATPLSRILLETDCPFLYPLSSKKDRRNDSAQLPVIVKKIAQIKEISEEEIEKVTTQNAKKLFQI